MESNVGFGKTDKVEEPPKSALDTQLELKLCDVPNHHPTLQGWKRKRRHMIEKPFTTSRMGIESYGFGMPFAYFQFLVFTSKDKNSLIKMWWEFKKTKTPPQNQFPLIFLTNQDFKTYKQQPRPSHCDRQFFKNLKHFFPLKARLAATAAKSLQSCPTLCSPIDGSPPGSPVPGILQVRTLEWVAISFSNAWKWKV